MIVVWLNAATFQLITVSFLTDVDILLVLEQLALVLMLFELYDILLIIAQTQVDIQLVREH